MPDFEIHIALSLPSQTRVYSFIREYVWTSQNSSILCFWLDNLQKWWPANSGRSSLPPPHRDTPCSIGTCICDCVYCGMGAQGHCLNDHGLMRSHRISKRRCESSQGVPEHWWNQGVPAGGGQAGLLGQAGEGPLFTTAAEIFTETMSPSPCHLLICILLVFHVWTWFVNLLWFYYCIRVRVGRNFISVHM